MPYLIDGHNLIPKVGLRLDSVDDELELIELLQAHGRRSRSLIEVFFDGAPAGQVWQPKVRTYHGDFREPGEHSRRGHQAAAGATRQAMRATGRW